MWIILYVIIEIVGELAIALGISPVEQSVALEPAKHLSGASHESVSAGPEDITGFLAPEISYAVPVGPGALVTALSGFGPQHCFKRLLAESPETGQSQLIHLAIGLMQVLAFFQVPAPGDGPHRAHQIIFYQTKFLR
jgi:hypothetical protein